MTKKAINLPIELEWKKFDAKGNLYKVMISITQSCNFEKFPPDGVKAVFKILKLEMRGNKKLIMLIDNHEPFGFHIHDKLPDFHDYRKSIHAKNWQEAWEIFEIKMKEIFP